MFHHNSHFDVWNGLHRRLKRGEFEAVAKEWQHALPELSSHYDDLRMLYYIGRFGKREPYQHTCGTLTALRNSDPEILRYRLSIFRYAVEHSSITNPDVMQWMLADLATILGITPADFPTEKLPMPPHLREELIRINPDLAESYTY